MTVTASLVDQFQDYANSFNRGYLKTWKAIGILSTLSKMPNITLDSKRMYLYLANCLEMEGFGGFEIEQIQKWLVEKNV